MKPLRHLLSVLALAACALVLGACATSNPQYADIPINKMILEDNTPAYSSTPTQYASADATLSRGTRLRIIDSVGGYLKVQTTSGDIYFVQPDKVGDITNEYKEPSIRF